MDLVGNLEELRKRIILTLSIFVIFLIGAFIFVGDIYHWLVRGMDEKLALLGPGEILWVYFTLSGVAALIMSTPFAAYQAWRFVLPALTPTERKVSLSYIPALFVLFVSGIGFGYFLVFPKVLSFVINLSENQFQLLFTSEKYFQFMFQLTIPFGFLFEMPVAILFLTSLGLLTPNRLMKSRKISYIALTLVAVSITPPDFISALLVLGPLFLLFEISVVLSKFAYRKKKKSEKVASAA